MKLCILSWAILFSRAQLEVATKEIRVRHTHDADPRVKGMAMPTKGKRSSLTTGRPTPKTATYEMEEGEHRSLRGRKRAEKRHIHSIFDVFDGSEWQTVSPRGMMHRDSIFVQKYGFRRTPRGHRMSRRYPGVFN